MSTTTLRMAALALLTTATLTAASAAAQAQDQGHGGSAAYGAAGPGGGPGGEQWRARLEAHRQEKLQALRTVLNLRPDQQPAFDAFIQSMRPPEHADWRRRQQEAPTVALTTLQRLDRMSERLNERTAMMRRRIDATRAFYAALSPEQQKVFDSLAELDGDGFGHHDGHRG